MHLCWLARPSAVHMSPRAKRVATSLVFVAGLATLLYVAQLSVSWRGRRLTPCRLASELTAALDEHPSQLDHQKQSRQRPLAAGGSSPRLPPVVGDLTASYAGSVFFVWCGGRRRQFEFRHYLSVLSAVRVLRPDNVFFYYENEPRIDGWLYNTWLDELTERFPFFHRRSLDDAVEYRAGDDAACDGHLASASFVYALVTAHGGTYVNEETVLGDGIDERLRRLDVVAAFGSVGPRSAYFGLGQRSRGLRILLARPGFPCTATALNAIKAGDRLHVVNCTSADDLIAANTTNAICLEMPNALFPKDIWDRDDSYGRLLRTVFYGQPEVPRPIPSYDQLAPNIGHMIWIGGGEMNFFFFLGALSLIHIAKVDVVYVHGDGPPTGRYWDLLGQTNQPVRFVLRENAAQVYGQSVVGLSHVSDTWRADILLKYGGIYMDTDAIFVRPLDRRLRAYDAVASFDWVDWYPPFPDIINLGITVGKPGARFWQLWLESMRWFVDSDWSWNGLRQPYRLLERHPELVHIDPHLQVICYKSRCHPTWWPDYHNERVHHRAPPAPRPPRPRVSAVDDGTAAWRPNDEKPLTLNWLNDTYVIHITYPIPYEYRDERALMGADGMLADIGKNVLAAADMFKHLGVSRR